jgi:hypothetical protein
MAWCILFTDRTNAILYVDKNVGVEVNAASYVTSCVEERTSMARPGKVAEEIKREKRERVAAVRAASLPLPPLPASLPGCMRGASTPRWKRSETGCCMRAL